MSPEADSLARAGIVAENWRQFETGILPKLAADLPAESKDLSQLSFHFGALMMLNLMQPLSRRTTGEGPLDAAYDAFRAEIEAYLMSRTKG